MTEKIRKVGFFFFSLFIVWHAAAISIVGPFSQSYFSTQLFVPYSYYLDVTKLSGAWSFYAPAFKGSIVSYETTDDAGETKEYPLTRTRSKWNNAYFRYTNFYAYLFYDQPYAKEWNYDKSVAHYLCSQHIGKKVKTINFILLNQQTFTHEDFNKGKRPLDDEFITKTIIGPYNCDQV